MKKKRKPTRKELENRIFSFLFLRDEKLLREFFDMTDKQVYDRARYLGVEKP
jgi:hypothetical protein